MRTTPGLKPTGPEEPGFSEIVQLIDASRQRAMQSVNTVLIDLYWQVGETISRKIEAAEWGDGVVPQLALYIARTQPGLRGFTRANLFRMRQFYETYRGDPIVAPLVRQLPWSHHPLIICTLSPALIAEYQTQLPDKKPHQAKLHEFYLQNVPEGEEQ